MICSHCGETLDAQPERCPACGEDPILEGKYRLEAVVGRGAAGITYRGVRLSDGLPVAIKEMPFHRIDAEKTLELFDRESRVLRQLDHPRIPAYVDDFVSGAGRHRSLYLLQTFIDGQTLAAELEGTRHREDDVLRIVIEVAEILTYLHDLRPAVIHRDLKPGNLMRRESDGAIVVVDFGAVRDALADPAMGGSTVVGTYGYMAPEQYRGDASPATDLYALGVTALVLLSRRSADEMAEGPGRLDWRSSLDAHPETTALLEALTALDPSDRPASAREVIRRATRAITAIEAAREPGRAAPASAAAPAPEVAPPTRPEDLWRAPDDLWNAPPAERPAWERADFDDGPVVVPPAGFSGSTSVAIVAMLGAALALIGWFLSTSPGESGRIKTPATRCGAEPCPPVARGLKGLEFGMTVEQATSALPALAGARRVSKSDGSIRPLMAHLDLPGVTLPVELPGPSLVVGTQIGALDAECRLDFAVNDTLSHMKCDLARQPTLGAHQAAAETLRDALVERYGPPSYSHTPPDERIMGVEHRAEWEWSDTGASLKLSSHFRHFEGVVAGIDLPPTSELSLENAAAEHADAISKAERAARARTAEARRKKAAQAAEATRRAREALEASKGKIVDDL